MKAIVITRKMLRDLMATIECGSSKLHQPLFLPLTEVKNASKELQSKFGKDKLLMFDLNREFEDNCGFNNTVIKLNKSK